MHKRPCFTKLIRFIACIAYITKDTELYLASFYEINNIHTSWKCIHKYWWIFNVNRSPDNVCNVQSRSYDMSKNCVNVTCLPSANYLSSCPMGLLSISHYDAMLIVRSIFLQPHVITWHNTSVLTFYLVSSYISFQVHNTLVAHLCQRYDFVTPCHIDSRH